jgi:predicted nucleic acid-binding protein
MSLVVSDTTSVNYLVLLRLDHVLHELYGQLFIPPAVLGELRHARSPEAVRRWANHLPAWVTIKRPTAPFVDDRLGIGELESIALAKELPATLLLLDDRAARRVAVENGLPVAGTVGVLENAAEQGLVDLKKTLELLVQTNFRIQPKVISDALDRLALKKRQ